MRGLSIAMLASAKASKILFSSAAVGHRSDTQSGLLSAKAGGGQGCELADNRPRLDAMLRCLMWRRHTVDGELVRPESRCPLRSEPPLPARK